MTATHLHRLHGVIAIVMNRLPLAFWARVSKTSNVDHVTVVESNKHSKDTRGRMHWLLEQTKLNDSPLQYSVSSNKLTSVQQMLDLNIFLLVEMASKKDTPRYLRKCAYSNTKTAPKFTRILSFFYEQKHMPSESRKNSTHRGFNILKTTDRSSSCTEMFVTECGVMLNKRAAKIYMHSTWPLLDK